MTLIQWPLTLAALIPIITVEALPAASNSVAAIVLESLGTRWDAYGSFLSEFNLTNASGIVVAYSGYASYPIYTTQIRRRAQWSDKPAVWCVTGIGDTQLPPNQSVTFTVPQPEGNQAWRIGVEFTSLGSYNGPPRTETAWSSTVKTTSSKGIERTASDATSLVQTEVSWHPDREFPYTFRLINKSTRTLYYGGYPEADVPPIYLNQQRHAGRWRDDGKADWNGSGSALGFKQLPAGESVIFSIPAQSLDSTWRIGLRLFRTDVPRAPNDAYRPVWWPELPPRGKTPNNIGGSSGRSQPIRSEMDRTGGSSRRR